jgi:hypothetical protein
MTPSEAVIVAACLLAGGVGALSFWLIARTRPSIEAGLARLQSLEGGAGYRLLHGNRHVPSSDRNDTRAT